MYMFGVVGETQFSFKQRYGNTWLNTRLLENDSQFDVFSVVYIKI